MHLNQPLFCPNNGEPLSHPSCEEYQDCIENILKVDGYGSGLAQKTVGIAVLGRFKKRRMSWHGEWANPLWKPRRLKLKGEWKTYLNKRREQVALYAN